MQVLCLRRYLRLRSRARKLSGLLGVDQDHRWRKNNVTTNREWNPRMRGYETED